MNIAAYCRVSTDKSDQLNSLETQKEFFLEYTKRTGDNLIKLYADEGISGTKIKNRKEFQRMLADAEKGLFDMVVVKDISRFAGNTVDQFDEETLSTVDKFFENSLNISETARQLFVHRNTLVYRLEKIQKQTGLDVRVFEDALTFKIALMVADHMKFIENRK